MAKVNGWSINTSGQRASIFLSENGKEVLIKDDRHDLAFVKAPNENTVITTSDTMIIINEDKQEITIQSR